MCSKPYKPTTDCHSGQDGYRIIWTPPDLAQPEVGYRFSSDAFLLASFARSFGGRFWCDLGTGSGVIAYTLAQGLGGEGLAFERQSALIPYARKNLAHLPVTLVEGDLRQFPMRRHCFDLTVCNPPFFEVHAGKINQSQTIAEARHTFYGGVEAFAATVHDALKPGGVFCFVFPYLLVERPLNNLLREGWYLAKRLFIRPFSQRDPKLVCVALRKQAGAPVVDSEIIQYKSHRLFTDEMQFFLRDGLHPDLSMSP